MGGNIRRKQTPKCEAYLENEELGSPSNTNLE